MPSGPSVLVIGGESMIGSALRRALRPSSRVLTTTRRPSLVGSAALYLEFERFEDWLCPPGIDVAVLCAGVTAVRLCSADPVRTARVNVDAACEVARRCIAAGAAVIFLSTNLVFDGSRAFRKAGDPPSPRSEYGRQKAECERRLQALSPLVTILRLTKVLGPGDRLFTSWRSALARGEPIHPYSDAYFAPVPLSCVVSVLLRLTRQPHCGVVQLSGSRDLSYAEAAEIGASALGVSPNLILPVPAPGLESDGEVFPSHTTLDGAELLREWRITVPHVEDTIRLAFTDPDALAVVHG